LASFRENQHYEIKLVLSTFEYSTLFAIYDLEACCSYARLGA